MQVRSEALPDQHVSAVVQPLEVERKLLLRTQHLEILLDLASPGARPALLEPMHLDVHGHVVVVPNKSDQLR